MAVTVGMKEAFDAVRSVKSCGQLRENRGSVVHFQTEWLLQPCKDGYEWRLESGYKKPGNLKISL